LEIVSVRLVEMENKTAFSSECLQQELGVCPPLREVEMAFSEAYNALRFCSSPQLCGEMSCK
jgi:hypothetical protein